MSKIALEPNASGTGTFSIASPNSNSNRTLTLPDASGTLATTADVSAVESVTLLGTLATTSGTSVTLSGLTLTSYKQLSVVCDSVSGSNTGVVGVLTNGKYIFVIGVNNQTHVGFGSATFDLASGIFCSLSNWTGNSNPPEPFVDYSGLTTASTSITFTISAGTFDAGSIRIYGVK
jgi:hypothetical protein